MKQELTFAFYQLNQEKIDTAYLHSIVIIIKTMLGKLLEFMLKHDHYCLCVKEEKLNLKVGATYWERTYEGQGTKRINVPYCIHAIPLMLTLNDFI